MRAERDSPLGRSRYRPRPSSTALVDGDGGTAIARGTGETEQAMAELERAELERAELERRGAPASSIPEYGHVFSGPGGAFGYLEPFVAGLLPRSERALRILDVGCGNGYWALRLAGSGHRVIGIDASLQRIENARREVPDARFERLEIGPSLLAQLGEQPFDVVISTEVVEHLFQPAEWAAACFAALRPGGRLICSTPYHGYLKNLGIALSNGWDRHHHTLRRLGHIKFFSEATLRRLLEQAGFANVRFQGAGRVRWLWKTMVMAGDRPVL